MFAFNRDSLRRIPGSAGSLPALRGPLAGRRALWLCLALILCVLGATLTGLFAGNASAQTAAQLQITPGDSTIREGESGQTFTISIPLDTTTSLRDNTVAQHKVFWRFVSHDTNGAVQNDYEAYEGGEILGRKRNTGLLNLAADSDETRSATILVKAIWDSRVETTPERFYLELYQASSNLRLPGGGETHRTLITINDRPTPITVADDDGYEQPSHSEREVVFQVTIPEAMRNSSPRPTVDWKITPGADHNVGNRIGSDAVFDASAADYTPPGGKSSGTLTFPDGQRTAAIVVVTVDDDLVEDNEIFTLTLSNPSHSMEFPPGDDGSTPTTLKAYGIIDSNNDIIEVSVGGGRTVEGGLARLPVTLERTLRPGESGSIKVAVNGALIASDLCVGSEMQAVENVDYRRLNFDRLLFGPGDRTKYLEIQTIEDPLDENDECLQAIYIDDSRLDMVDADGGRFRLIYVPRIKYFVKEVIIEDDDDLPYLSVANPAVREPDEGETAQLNYVAKLSQPSGRTVTLDYRGIRNASVAIYVDSGLHPAAYPSDYEDLDPGTLSFRPGETRKEIAVTVKGDYDEEPDEIVVMEFGNNLNACWLAAECPSNAWISQLGYILNDDHNLRLSFTLDDLTIREGDAAVLRLTLSQPIEYDLRANVAPQDGTATLEADFGDASNRQANYITVPQGQTEATLTLPVHDDTVSGEGVETFSFSLTGVDLNQGSLTDATEWKKIFGSSYDIASIKSRTTMPTASILDGPALSLTPSKVKVTEGQPVELRAFLGQPAPAPVTFSWKTRDGVSGAADVPAARAGQDYTAPTAQSVTIPAGQTEVSLPAIQTLQDTLDEPDQYFTVLLESVTGATADDVESAVALRDDDSRPGMSITDATAAEGGDLSFTISLDAPSERTVSVAWITEDGTATTVDNDYVGMDTRQTLTFAPGEQSKTIVVQSLADTRPEPDEVFRIQLAHAPHAKFTDPTGVGTITNDDGTRVSVSDAAPVTEGSGDSSEFTITVTPAQDTPLTVQWATEDGPDGSTYSAQSDGTLRTGRSDFVAASGSVTFAAGETTKTVTVTVNDDQAPENTEEFRLRISGDATRVDFSDGAIGYAKIEDDDALDLEIVGSIPEAITEGTTAGRSNDPIYSVTLRRPAPPNDWGTWYGMLACAVHRPNPPLLQSGETPAGLPTGTAQRADFEFGAATRTEGSWSSLPCYHRLRVGELAEAYFFSLGDGVYERTFSLRVRGDNQPEDNEVISIWLVPSNGHWDLASPEARLGKYLTTTIMDDERRQVSITGPAAVDEDVGRATFTVSLSRSHTAELHAYVGVRSGTATANEDYLVISEKVTFTPGQTQKSVTVPIVEDDRVELTPETFTVFLEEPAEGVNIHPLEGEVTVEINDTSWMTVRAPDRVVDEGETFDIRFNLSEPILPGARWLDVHGTAYITTAGLDLPAAATDVDYSDWVPSGLNRQFSAAKSYPAQQILIPEGARFASARLATVEDSLIETDEDLGVFLEVHDGALFSLEDTGLTERLGFSGYFPGTNDSGRLTRLTIRDNDSGSVAFSGYDNMAALDGYAWTAPAPTISGVSIGHVTWTLSGDDAALFTIDPDTGEMTLPAQDSQNPADHDADNVFEVTVQATDEDGNTHVKALRVTVSNLPTVSVGDAPAVAEGNDPNATVDLTFPLTLSAAAIGDAVTVTYSLGGSATAASDYTAPDPLSATVAVGSQTGSIVIPVKGDVVDEADETITVTLTGVTRAILSPTAAELTGSGTVTDDDAPPGLSVTDANVGEGGQASFVVSLSEASEREVTFQWGTRDDASGSSPAAAGADYTAVTALPTVTIAAGATSATLEVQTAHDTVDEANETFLVELSSPVHATLADPQGVGTVTDDDGPPTLSVADASASEGSSASFVVSLSETSEREVTFQWGTKDDAGGANPATAGADYTAVTASPTATIAAGATSATLEVQTAQDTVDEADETFLVELSSPVHATLADPQGVGTVTEPQPLERLALRGNRPRVSIQFQGPDTITEGDVVNVVATARPATTVDLTVNFFVGYEFADTGDIKAFEHGWPENGGWFRDERGIGLQEVTIPAGMATATYAISTWSDGANLDGKIWAAMLTAGIQRTDGMNNIGGTDGSLGTYTPDPDSLAYDVGAPAYDEVKILDGTDAQGPRLSIVSGDPAVIPSGTAAVFIIKAHPPAEADIPVNVKVETDGNVLDSAETGDRVFTIPAGESGVRVAIPTIANSAPETATVTLTLLRGPYTRNLHVPLHASVEVNDNPTLRFPTVEISPANGVTEGESLAFTLTANPAPTQNRRVLVRVVTNGDYGIDSGYQDLNIPTGGSATLILPTTDDAVDEADGSVTVMLRPSYGYRIGPQWSSKAAVADNDVTSEVSVTAGAGVTEGGDARFTVTASPAPTANLDVSFTVSASGDYGATTGRQTVTIPATGSATLTVGTTNDDADEADGSVTVTLDTPAADAGYTVSATQGAATVTVADDDDPPILLTTPEVSVSAGSGVTEGGDARFTVTASPAPAANLDVSVTVSQSGDYGAATGARTVTIPTTGSVTLTVGTTNDGADEADGSVTVTVNTDSGYTVSSSQGAATVSVADDDPPTSTTPEVSVSAGSVVTEGGDASFTITASPAPAANLDVSVTVSQSGDYGAATGQRTVTIPTTGSVTLTVGTTNDGSDEADGSVTATLDTPAADAGYTVSSSQGAATVSVADDDPPSSTTPEVSVSAGSVVTEGGDAGFTITASPAPAANLDVSVTVSQSGDYGATTGQRTVTIPTTGSVTLTVGTTNDGSDEADGSVTVTVNTDSGYTVSSSQGAATVPVADDDVPEVSISAGNGVTEGDDASFTVTASPSPAEELDVSVTVSQSGDYGATTGQRTVTIPTTGSVTLTVDTTDDAADEVDGSVTATLDTPSAAAGYTVSATQGAATVSVADDDDPAPEVKVSVTVEDASGTEGDVVEFRILLSPALTEELEVSWSAGPAYHLTDWAKKSDYQTMSGRMVFEPGVTEMTGVVWLKDDDEKEPDEYFAVEAYLPGEWFTPAAVGTMTIVDDD